MNAVLRYGLQAVLYGAFAAMPVFLIWLSVSWGIILVGALVTAELPRVLSPPARRFESS